MKIDYKYLHDAFDRVNHTTTVDVFHYQFQAIQSLLSFVHPDIPEAYFASRFVYGLQEEYQKFVIRFHPVTVIGAYRLASIFEESIYLEYFPEIEFPNDEIYAISTVEYHKADMNIISTSNRVMVEDVPSNSLHYMTDKEPGLTEEDVLETLIGYPSVVCHDKVIHNSIVASSLQYDEPLTEIKLAANTEGDNIYNEVSSFSAKGALEDNNIGDNILKISMVEDVVVGLFSEHYSDIEVVEEMTLHNDLTVVDRSLAKELIIDQQADTEWNRNISSKEWTSSLKC